MENAQYTPRPGSYGVIRDHAGNIAVVRAGDGKIYLPGGGTDPGETPEQTLFREAREECGRQLDVGRLVGRAVQYLVNRSGHHFAKHCTYFEGIFRPGSECPPTEPDHTLLWLTSEEAERALCLPADVWAVRQARGDDSEL